LQLRQFESSIHCSAERSRWPEIRLSGFVPQVPVRAEIVLLHDLGACAASLTALATGLSDHGFRVLVPDLPGHGATEARLPRGLRDFSEIVEALFEQSPNGEVSADAAGDPVVLPRFLGGLGWGASAALNVAAGSLGDVLSGIVLIEPLLSQIPATLQPTVRAGVGYAQRLEAAEALLERWRLDWLLGGLRVRVPVTQSAQLPGAAALPYRLYRPFSSGAEGLQRTFWCENPVLAMLPNLSHCIDVGRAATQIESFGTGFEVRQFEHADLSLVHQVADWLDGLIENPGRETPQPMYPPGLPSHPSHRKPTWIG
jgi:pimeloyl-ACP methyl ester carboxylesterase